MNGAIAEPPPITINTPNKSKIMMIGANQNFLRCFKNFQMSFKKSMSYY